MRLQFPHSSGRRLAAFAAAWLAAALAVLAGIPEPGIRLYGTIALDGVAVTAAATSVRVEARRTADGPAIASYTMGSLTNAGNLYSLAVDAESAGPLSDTNAVVLGGTLHLVVLDGSVVKDRLTVVVAARGQRQRLDFGSPDTDGDGLSDAFELANFGTTTAGDPAADTDGDGRPNLREFLQGTDPTQADGRHPADVSPADDRLTLGEVTDYILAWKTGATNWPVEPPLNAPNIEDYITRAGALWKGGEFYGFTNTPPTNAPMWWVNRTSTNGTGSDPGLLADAKSRTRSGIAKARATARRTLPQTFRFGSPIRVAVELRPEDETRAYAVSESIPEGWRVQNIGAEGRWDAVQRKIKWGPYFDNTPRTLTYEALALSANVATGRFQGRASFDGAGFGSTGPNTAFAEGSFPKPRLGLSGTSTKMLVVIGEPGRSYRVEQSEGLGAWTAGPTVTVEASGLATLPMETEVDSRFFRLVSVE